jgi:hypothetical protein
VLADRVGVLIGELEKDRSRDGDLAAVVLLEYYLGEPNDEDVWDDVLTRGRRVTRIVDRLRRGETPCGLGELESLKLQAPELRRRLKEILDMIKRGEPAGGDL